MDNHHRSFAVDGDVDRLGLRVLALARLRIQFDEADVAEYDPKVSHIVPLVGSRSTPGSMALLSSTPSDQTIGPASSHL